MWQRFTERARRVVFFAQEEAGILGENYVSTEHLLLGLIREDHSVAARILDRMGISLGRIRSEVERQVARGDGRLGQDMQLTPRSKRVVDLAYEEARRISDDHIGTEHLLLGLIRESEGLAGRVLTRLGVELERARNQLHALRQEKFPISPPQHATFSASSLRHRITVDAQKWRKKSLVSLLDVTPEQFREVLEVAKGLKSLDLTRSPGVYWDYPRTLAMLFEKPSLRTRVSFEVSMTHLRGQAINLAPNEIGLGERESVQDVASVLSRWVDIISARVFAHETVVGLAQHATIPVINALSDQEHPLQALADLMTLEEKKGLLGNNLKMAYVGDGNNVLHALMLACAMMGVNLAAGCPEGYPPDPKYVAEARKRAAVSGATLEIVTDPRAAVQDADAVYTDVWASMGQEAESAMRAQLFRSYQLNAELLARAKPDAIALHCLPAHRGEEISEEIMESHAEAIYEQAENRMHTQKALLAMIIGL